MLKKEIPEEDTNNWGRVCDSCCSVPSTVYCRADNAYLCTSCDANIHSANPLARRHHRVPIMSVGSTMGSADGFFALTKEDETIDEGQEDEAASWLLLNPGKGSYNQNTDGYLLEGEVDEYLDLFEYNSGMENHFCEGDNQKEDFGVEQKKCGGDRVVPVQCAEGKDWKYQNFLLGMEWETNSEYGYTTSISHGVSVSSMDVGVVPESTMSDISLSHPRPPKDTIELFSSPPVEIPTQLCSVDRQARVMRYREKKKTRKFEKTIRYASRKAYAETRPRIKGRFAKRSDVEAEMDNMFLNPHMPEVGYGIVPSF